MYVCFFDGMRAKRDERRRADIVRILFMPPIYAVISFASYLFWVRSSPLSVLLSPFRHLIFLRPHFNIHRHTK